MALVVYKNRTNIIKVKLNRDVSSSTITSEIRTQDSTLIATWTVTFESDGTDGVLKLTLDNSITSAIEYSRGFMDLKEVIAGEPYQVFDEPVEVEFRNTVTA